MLLSGSVTVIPASRATDEPFSVKARLATVAVTTGRPLTLIVIVSLSVKVPPVPVLPWSLVTIWRLAVPEKAAVGLKLSPASAVLTAAIVPVNVIVASAVPSPTVKVRPVTVERVVAPLVLTSWACTAAAAASTSLIEIRLPLPVENTLAVFGGVDWVAGHGVDRRVVDRRDVEGDRVG